MQGNIFRFSHWSPDLESVERVSLKRIHLLHKQNKIRSIAQPKAVMDAYDPTQLSDPAPVPVTLKNRRRQTSPKKEESPAEKRGWRLIASMGERAALNVEHSPLCANKRCPMVI